MELRQLRTFEAVARHRSFTRASKELMVAQPAVSQQVRRLERELGVDLLRRTSCHVALTEPGEALLAGARRVLAEAASVVDELQALRGLRSGRVAVGAMPPMPRLDVPSLIAAFHARHPAIGVRLDEDTAANALAMLRRGELDLSFAFLSPEEAGAELAGVLLLEEELGGRRPRPPAGQAPAAAARRAGRRDARGLQVGLGPARGRRRGAGRRRRGPRIAFESNELLTVRAIAALGLAVAILPRGYVDVPHADVVGIPLGSRPVRQPVSLLWRAGERLSPAATAFREFVQTGSLSSDATGSGEASVRYGRHGSAMRSISSGRAALEAVGALDRPPDPEVADRQHVGAPQLEHQEHVDAPRAEPLTVESSAITSSSESSSRRSSSSSPVDDVLGQRAQVRDLGVREPGGRAQLLGIVGQHLLRRRRAPAEAVGQAPVDRARGLGRQLLADDRAHERAVLVGAPARAPWRGADRVVGPHRVRSRPAAQDRTPAARPPPSRVVDVRAGRQPRPGRRCWSSTWAGSSCRGGSSCIACATAMAASANPVAISLSLPSKVVMSPHAQTRSSDVFITDRRRSRP